MHFSNFLHLVRKYRIHVHPERRYVGILFTLFGWFLLAFSTVLFRQTSLNNPIFVNYFFQFSATFIALMLFALPRGFSYLKLNKPWLVLVRGAIAVVTYYLYFISKTWIDIVDNSILFSSDAILIPVILFLFLNVKINYLQWIGILIGFCGIGFVYSFDLKLHTLHGFIAGLIGLSSGIGLAVIIVLQSYMVKNDPPLRIALYQSIIGLFSAGMIAYFNWQTPTFSDSLYMIFGGIFFAVALFLFLDSFYYTETYVIGVLNYSIVLFVEGLNWIINKEPINLKTIIGSLIIILGGMITIMVTYHLDKKRSKIS